MLTCGKDSIAGQITEYTDRILSLRSTNEQLNTENQILADKFNKLAEYNQVLGDDLANFDDEIVYMERIIANKTKRMSKLSRKVDSVNRSISKCRGILMDDDEFSRNVTKLKRMDDMRTAIFKRLQELKGDSWTPDLEDSKISLLNEVESLEDERQDLEEIQHLLEILADDDTPADVKQQAVDNMLKKKESEQQLLLDEIEQLKEQKSRKIVRKKKQETASESEAFSADEKDKEYHDKQRQILLLKDPASYHDMTILFDDTFTPEPSPLEPAPVQRSSSSLAKRKRSSTSKAKRAASSLATQSVRQPPPEEDSEVKAVCRVGVQDLVEAEAQVDEEELDPVVRSRAMELSLQEKDAVSKLEALQDEIRVKKEEREALLASLNASPKVVPVFVRGSSVNVPPEPDAVHDLSLCVFEKHSKSVATDLTGHSIDFHLKLLHDQALEMTVATDLQDSIKSLREQIDRTTKKIDSVKQQGRETEKQIRRVKSDLRTAKRNIENEQAMQEQENAAKREIMIELDELKESIKEKQERLEKQTAKNAAAGERLEELLRIRQGLERDLEDLAQREKPEVQTLAREVQSYQMRVKESRQRLETAEEELQRKREKLDHLKHSPEMQTYKDLITEKAKLDRRMNKWKMLLKDSRETLQSLEVFSAQNVQRRQSLTDSLNKYQRMKIDKEEELRELEQYSALLSALLEEQTKKWT